MKLEILKALNEARRERRAAIVVTDTVSGEERLVDGGAVQKDPLAAELGKRLLLGSLRRCWRTGGPSSPSMSRRRV